MHARARERYGDSRHFPPSLRQILATPQILAQAVPLSATYRNVLGSFSIGHIGGDVKLREDDSLAPEITPETSCWGD